MTETVSREGLHEQLARWVAAGLIDAGQATRIEEAETSRAAAPPSVSPAAAPPSVSPAAAPAPVPAAAPAAAPARRRRPPSLVVEALGYLGGALAIVAGFMAVRELWPGIPVAAQLAFAATAAVALAAGGAVVRLGADPALARLRSVLWVMSAACLAAFTAVLGDSVLHFSITGTVTLAAAVATGYTVVLWMYTRTALQQLAMFVAAEITVGAGISLVSPGSRAWGPGLGVWGLAALWSVAAHRGYIVPRDTGYVAAGIGLLVGAQMTMDVAAGHVLAIATVAALLIAGIGLRRVWLLAIGTIGVIQIVPQTAVRYLPSSAAAPVAVFLTGIVLLGVALWLSRWRKAR